MKSKEKAVNGLTGGIQFLFKKNKVNGVFGHGSVVSPNEVKVVDDSGKEEIIKTKNILIATGSDVASLPGIDVRSTMQQFATVTSVYALFGAASRLHSSVKLFQKSDIIVDRGCRLMRKQSFPAPVPCRSRRCLRRWWSLAGE